MTTNFARDSSHARFSVLTSLLSKPDTGTTNSYTPWHEIWRATEGTTRDSVREYADQVK